MCGMFCYNSAAFSVYKVAYGGVSVLADGGLISWCTITHSYLGEVLVTVNMSPSYLGDVLVTVNMSPSYLGEVLVTVDMLSLVRILQLMLFYILPEGVNNLRSGLGVNAEKTRQTGVQFEFLWLVI